MNLAILASGELGYDCLRILGNNFRIMFVMTDHSSEQIIDYCTERDIPIFIGNPRNRTCNEFIADKKIDILISINYLFIIEKDLITLPQKIAFNIHGSLLPKYRGRTPHVWAIINNEVKTGITAHLIEEECDSGDIIKQLEIPILHNDTGARILNKFRSMYIPLIEEVLNDIKSGNLKQKPQDHSKATFFLKRSPEDGIINWDWHKERIYNWVRAQAYPYPGAYTFCNSTKIIIDQISEDDTGYEQTTPNGLILSIDPIRVKTPNGVIRLDNVREGYDKIKKGVILGHED